MKKSEITLQDIFSFLSTLTDEEIMLCKNAKRGNGMNNNKPKSWRLHKEFTSKVFNSIPGANTGTVVTAWKIIRSI